jgi:hypothetical protein
VRHPAQPARAAWLGQHLTDLAGRCYTATLLNWMGKHTPTENKLTETRQEIFNSRTVMTLKQNICSNSNGKI